MTDAIDSTIQDKLSALRVQLTKAEREYRMLGGIPSNAARQFWVLTEEIIDFGHGALVIPCVRDAIDVGLHGVDAAVRPCAKLSDVFRAAEAEEREERCKRLAGDAPALGPPPRNLVDAAALRLRQHLATPGLAEQLRADHTLMYQVIADMNTVVEARLTERGIR